MCRRRNCGQRAKREGKAKAFLAGEGCIALAGQLTGEGYNAIDFLGSGIANIANLAAEYAYKALDDDDESNDKLARFLLVARAAIGSGLFAQCVDTARGKCRARWASLHQTEPVDNRSSTVIGDKEPVWEIWTGG
jgi:uncharacterized Ntn-hydrolase superfamily protein